MDSVLAYNAGEGHRATPLADITVEDFERTVDVNLRTIFPVPEVRGRRRVSSRRAGWLGG